MAITTSGLSLRSYVTYSRLPARLALSIRTSFSVDRPLFSSKQLPHQEIWNKYVMSRKFKETKVVSLATPCTTYMNLLRTGHSFTGLSLTRTSAS